VEFRLYILPAIFITRKSGTMLRAHTNQEQIFDYYASFLRHVLSGEDKYKALVEPVISDTKLLIQKQKDYFTISRNGFEVIVFLANKDPQFFAGLNTANISNNDYQHILNLIMQQKDLIVA